MGALVRFLLPSPFCFSSYLRQDVFFLQKFYLCNKILGEATIETWFPLENWKISQMQSVICQIFVIKSQIFVTKCQISVIKWQIFVIKCQIFVIKCKLFFMLCQIFVLFTFICTELWSSFESSRFWGGSGMLKRKGVISNRMSGNSGEIIKSRMNFHERLHVFDE